MTARHWLAPLVPPLLAAAGLAACSPPAPEALPPQTFAFGFFGDAPYNRFDMRAYSQLVADAGASDVQFLVHVGDLHGGQCGNASLGARLQSLRSIAVPVIYTPGDNEWTDCHGAGAGGFQPLERLARIRATFFATPGRSLGARPMAVASQASDPAWREFVENARWRFGGFAFATIHVPGSGNGTLPFPARRPADDRAATRRMEAALAWLEATFAEARRDSLRGVFIAMHADPFFELRGPRTPYEPLLRALERHAGAFDGIVVLMHGDSHTYRVDRPLVRVGTRDTVASFERIETFGSPDVGWVRVVVDSANGRVARIEPRRMQKRLGM